MKRFRSDGTALPRVTVDEARRIVADILVAEALAGARVEFGVGDFYRAPSHPVWLVHPRPEGLRVGASRLIAICPQTGRVLFNGLHGE